MFYARSDAEVLVVIIILIIVIIIDVLFLVIVLVPVVFGKRLKAEPHLTTVFLTLYMALEVFSIIERVLVILVNDIA